MPATIDQRKELSATSEPPLDGPDSIATWHTWAATPEGKRELERQAREVLDYYDEVLKPLHEPHDNGKFIVLEWKTKEYELAPTSPEARRQLRARGVEGDYFTLEVGNPLIYMRGYSALSSFPQ